MDKDRPQDRRRTNRADREAGLCPVGLQHWRRSTNVRPLVHPEQLPHALLTFCANDQLTVATFGNEQTQYVVVACSECGAMDPRASTSDPPGHAEHLWNQRFGADAEN